MLNRPRAISNLRTNIHQTRRYDVAIIGAGVVGSAVAVSCARRGWSVLVLDKGDLAGETSSNSTGLLHGGARYAEKLEFGMVLSAIRGREYFKKAFPNLVVERQYFVPAFQAGKHGYRKMQIGRWLYDLTKLFGLSSFPRGRTISAAELSSENIPWAQDKVRGGSFFWDGQTDDHRLALTMLMIAAQHQADIISRMECRGFVHDGGREGGVSGIEARDLLSDEIFNVKADAIVNAAGPWAQDVYGLNDPPASQFQTLDAGSHLIVRNFFGRPMNFGFFAEFKDGRLVFILPHGRNLLVGTTSEGRRESIDNVLPVLRHNQYLLNGVNNLFPFAALKPADIIYAYSAHRALFNDTKAKNSDALSRENKIFISPQGLITIIGGKITTAPLIGEKVASLVARGKNLPFDRLSTKMPFESLDETDRLLFVNDKAQILMDRYHIDRRRCEHLLLKYGMRARAVLDAAEGDEKLLLPLEPGGMEVGAQVVYAARNEMALGVIDVLSRRIRLEREVGNGLSASSVVSHILAKELDWSKSETAAQAAAYHERVRKVAQAVGREV
ncbi:glycerol-3-phosphate dehydrogenase/oxidase [Candidatus Saganbacteria bacterium]|nr:glycerol-3-phosphate dehydrogenase/oxidase [Candidatus Saganbacteria bacterium]